MAEKLAVVTEGEPVAGEGGDEDSGKKKINDGWFV